MKGPRSANLFSTAILFLSIAFSTATPAKTLYIERSGTNAPSCGTRASPCQTIFYTLGVKAKKNDKLVVGPGYYRESIAIDSGTFGPLDGIKLESSAGRFATIIESVSSIAPVIQIAQPRIKIGKKGKGFTLIGGLAGVLISNVNAINTKIEGNFITKGSTGISAIGSGHQISSNLIKDNTAQGIYCSSCNKVIIRDNQFVDNQSFGALIRASSNLVAMRNIFVGNGSHGLIFSVNMRDSKISDSAFSDNVGVGVFIDDADGVTLQGNVASRNTLGGAFIDQDTPTRSPLIKSNLALKNGSYGFGTESLVEARIENNGTYQNGTDGLQVSPISSFKTFKNNNTVGDDSGCGIKNISPIGFPVTYGKHYFFSATVCGIHDPFSTTTTRPNPVNVNKARKL